MTRPEYECIRVESVGAVTRLTLNRPERLNAFNVAMHEEMGDALMRVRADRTVRVLILTGAGRGFCAGQDLTDRASQTQGAALDLGASLERFYNPLVLSLRSLEVPVIAAVNGVAAGAGANLALACDMVVAARSASFIQSFAKLGLVPDCGGTWFLPRLVGPARAMGLALLGDKLGAVEAAAWGLIWRCVADEELDTTVTELAARLAAGAPRGLARTKQALHGSTQHSLEQQLLIEQDFQRELGRTADFAEGVAAFRDKRAARFTGT
ncbi:MAG TPA: 2-(1,2-epoxy-1,2-dihydrophenyl)acetyl-CoA isomerase PaaG [Steroidobacteraceae bacterium]|nr:2-(1,2-epoxy-1,2-dihydrophenyl)acetyl-CoA isomerase PaaG [Steroidobacteraceae bacterium]